MTATHYRTCPLCEATCGVAIEVDGDRVVSIRGDEADPGSRGYICPKGTALADLHHDPDRLRRPMLRTGSSWREACWDEALDLVATKILEVRKRHGRDAVGAYQGNPTAHSLGLMTFGQLLLRTLKTKNLYSAVSVDTLPHLLAAFSMFGHQLLMPVPDIDRCDLFICLGANPVATHGMGAPDVKAKFAAIRERGGRVIVLDPRRTETAERADRHLFLRPGTDAVLLLAMIQTIFVDGLTRVGLPVRNLDVLERAARPWTPERAAKITGVAANDIRELARSLATVERAMVYGRIGVCTQEYGGLAAWLVYALDAITGHLDTPGGLMFTTPAIDPVAVTTRLGATGSFAAHRSRVSGKPEFNGELPVAVLAEEIETPGPGQIRALLTSAGNPVLSTPGGPRLERALAGLDFMVSIDPYLNETTRHAHVILPPTSPLEHSHYDLALAAFAIRNGARYSAPVFERPPDARHDWEICAGLWARMLPIGKRLATRALGKLGPEALLDLGLRLGPHRLSLAKVRAAEHGIDLGALVPRFPDRLATPDKRVDLAPAIYLADLARLDRMPTPDGLVLIGRRQLRSNNSWMHNSPRLLKGKPRCTLMIHPADAATRGLVDGANARVSTRVGAVELAIEITDAVMPGVVSIPHGWGHNRPGTRLRIAATQPGVSMNDILDPARTDTLSGTSVLSGQAVEVAPA